MRYLSIQAFPLMMPLQYTAALIAFMGIKEDIDTSSLNYFSVIFPPIAMTDGPMHGVFN